MTRQLDRTEAEVKVVKADCIRIERIQPLVEYPSCHCGKPATHGYQLLTRIVYRCLDHEADLISPVYEKWAIGGEK